jgi:hypothetical protein
LNGTVGRPWGARGQALMCEESAILNEIKDTRPLTIAGIVVQFRISNWANDWTEESPDDDYFNHLAGVALRNAERLAGMANEGRQEGRQS